MTGNIHLLEIQETIMYKHVNNVRATKQICNKQQMKIESKLERKKSAPPPFSLDLK